MHNALGNTMINQYKLISMSLKKIIGIKIEEKKERLSKIKEFNQQTDVDIKRTISIVFGLMNGRQFEGMENKI